jgi:hypothetical protein
MNRIRLRLRLKFRLLLLPLVASALSACAVGNALWQAEQSCLKYPTPDTRAECEKRSRATDAAYVKETEKSEAQARARAKAEADLQTQEAPAEGSKPAPQKKNELCFKRASGEMVCPN